MNQENLKNDPFNFAIVFAGVIGAGKTTASKYLIEKYHYTHLSYVDLIWLPILEKRGIKPTRESLQDLGDELREKYGIRNLAKMIIPFIPSGTSIVIDDIRHPDAYDELKKSLPYKIFLIYIKTSTSMRVPRLEIRDNLSSFSELAAVDQRQTEITISNLEPLADFIILNNDTLDAFYKSIDQCMQRMNKEYNYEKH